MMKEVGYGKDADYVSRNTVNQQPPMLIYSCTWSEGFGVLVTYTFLFFIIIIPFRLSLNQRSFHSPIVGEQTDGA